MLILLELLLHGTRGPLFSTLAVRERRSHTLVATIATAHPAVFLVALPLMLAWVLLPVAVRLSLVILRLLLLGVEVHHLLRLLSLIARLAIETVMATLERLITTNSTLRLLKLLIRRVGITVLSSHISHASVTDTIGLLRIAETLILTTNVVGLGSVKGLALRMGGLRIAHVGSLLIRALTRFTKHKLSELFALNLPIDFIRERADVLRKHRLLRELLRVVLLDTLQISWLRHLGLVYDRLHIVLQLFHYILVL